jgi:hypothetical protein
MDAEAYRSPLQMGSVGSVHELASGGDSWWGLWGQSKTEPFHEKSLIWIWLGVTAQDQDSTIVGWEMNIEHLDAGELIEHGARGETRRQRLELRSRSEAMLEAYEVTESNWRDATTRSPHFAISESPAFVGRAVAASTAASPMPGGTSPKFRTPANPPT